MDNNYFLQLEYILDEVDNKNFYLMGWGYGTDILHYGDLYFSINATPQGEFECHTLDYDRTFNNKEEVIKFLNEKY